MIDLFFFSSFSLGRVRFSPLVMFNLLSQCIELALSSALLEPFYPDVFTVLETSP